MSVAVACSAEKGACIGYDSALTNTDGEQWRIRAKGFVTGPIGVVSVGRPRVEQVLRYYWPREVYPPAPCDDVERWAVCHLVPALKRLGDDHSLYAGEDNSGWLDAVFAVRGVVFSIDGDWHVFAPECGYITMGSGSSLAASRLHETDWMHPEQRVADAVRSTAEHCDSVSLPEPVIWVPE